MAITEYEIIDHGVDHAQYFQGCGVSFSRFTHCVTGGGDSAGDAADDAAEQAACSGATLPPALEAEILAMDDNSDAHTNCECPHGVIQGAGCLHEGCEESDWHDSCELYHYVSIRWREE